MNIINQKKMTENNRAFLFLEIGSLKPFSWWCKLYFYVTFYDLCNLESIVQFFEKVG